MLSRQTPSHYWFFAVMAGARPHYPWQETGLGLGGLHNIPPNRVAGDTKSIAVLP